MRTTHATLLNQIKQGKKKNLKQACALHVQSSKPLKSNYMKDKNVGAVVYQFALLK